MSDPLNDPAVRRKLAVLRHVDEVTGNVAMTCRYFGFSRQHYYTWLRRYQDEGLDGLRDRSRRPKTCPHETHAEVVEKIVHLRRTYHFGPTKISMYLQRYHDVTVSRSGVWRILKRLGLNRLPASQRYQRRDRKWKRYEKQQPGHRVQIDVKFIEPLTTTAAAPPPAARRAPLPAARPVPRLDRGGGARTTSSPRSMTAPDYACCASTPSATKRPRSSSSTTSWADCPSRSKSSRPTTAPNSKQRFTGMCRTRALVTSTSNPAHPDSTAKSNAHTASTPKNSTAYSTV